MQTAGDSWVCAHAFSYWTILENVIDGARVHTSNTEHIRHLLWGNGRFIESHSLLLLSANFRDRYDVDEVVNVQLLSTMKREF